MIKGAIFDMDGVLVDNRDIHLEAFSLWCQRAGLDIDKYMLLGYFGMSNDEIFPAILGRKMTAEELKRASDEKEAIYREIFASQIRPAEGLVELLGALKERGVPIAVGSSGMRKNVDYVLEKCGIASFFDVIVDGDQLERAKPDPEVFVKCAAGLGLPQEECLVFEDSFAGIEAARAAGMRVVALATTFGREQHKDYDLLIDNFTQTTADQVLAL